MDVYLFKGPLICLKTLSSSQRFWTTSNVGNLGLIYPCDGKAEFSAVSLDPSEIILICWFNAQDTYYF